MTTSKTTFPIPFLPWPGNPLTLAPFFCPPAHTPIQFETEESNPRLPTDSVTTRTQLCPPLLGIVASWHSAVSNQQPAASSSKHWLASPLSAHCVSVKIHSQFQVNPRSRQAFASVHGIDPPVPPNALTPQSTPDWSGLRAPFPLQPLQPRSGKTLPFSGIPYTRDQVKPGVPPAGSTQSNNGQPGGQAVFEHRQQQQ